MKVNRITISVAIIAFISIALLLTALVFFLTNNINISRVISEIALLWCLICLIAALVFMRHKGIGYKAEIDRRLLELENKIQTEPKSSESDFQTWRNNEYSKVEPFVLKLQDSLNKMKISSQELMDPRTIELKHLKVKIIDYNQALKGISNLMSPKISHHFDNLRVEKVESMIKEIDNQIADRSIIQNTDTQETNESVQKLTQSLSFLLSQAFKRSDENAKITLSIPVLNLKSLTKTFARYIDDEYKETREKEKEIEEVFNDVLKIVELEQIRPEKGDELDSKYHEIEGEQRSDIPRNAIVRTAVRGFVDANGISKARVIIAS
jgi:hypothetical protein